MEPEAVLQTLKQRVALARVALPRAAAITNLGKRREASFGAIGKTQRYESTEKPDVKQACERGALLSAIVAAVGADGVGQHERAAQVGSLVHGAGE